MRLSDRNCYQHLYRTDHVSQLTTNIQNVIMAERALKLPITKESSLSCWLQMIMLFCNWDTEKCEPLKRNSNNIHISRGHDLELK